MSEQPITAERVAEIQKEIENKRIHYSRDGNPPFWANLIEELCGALTAAQARIDRLVRLDDEQVKAISAERNLNSAIARAALELSAEPFDRAAVDQQAEFDKRMAANNTFGAARFSAAADKAREIAAGIRATSIDAIMARAKEMS